MAAAEARAAWQRAANRCFVQEDAKRAPKLACQSSSSKHVDAGATNPADGLDHHPLGFMPFNKEPSYTNLPPDAWWWLQMEPNYCHQKGFTCVQLNTMAAADKETTKADLTKTNSGEVRSQDAENAHVVSSLNMESSFDVNCKPSVASLKKRPEFKVEEPNAEKGKIDQDFLDVKEMTDYYEYMEMKLVGGSVSKRYLDLSFDSESSWVGGDTVWWCKTDNDEFASMVSQTSVHRIENCDLPPPQKMCTRRDVLRKTGRLGGQDEVFFYSHEWEVGRDAISSPSAVDNPSSGGTRGSSQGSSKIRGHIAENELLSISDSDPGKAQLMEALCHSQTRAREAENAAKQAYTEKEHILKLFLKQASYLFAYKQLFRLLQLESYLLDKSVEPTSPFFPILASWTPVTAGKRKQYRSSPKAAKVKRPERGEGRLSNDVGKYAVAFAVGLGLVSAGLLLGWTVGWLLPAF